MFSQGKKRGGGERGKRGRKNKIFTKIKKKKIKNKKGKRKKGRSATEGKEVLSKIMRVCDKHDMWLRIMHLTSRTVMRGANEKKKKEQKDKENEKQKEQKRGNGLDPIAIWKKSLCSAR
jgi:hypothetical protein